MPIFARMLRLPIPSLDGTTTERLRFRRPVPEDSAWWMGYMNDPTALRFMPFTLGSQADCDAFIARCLERMAKDGSGLHALVHRGTDAPLGMIGLLTQEVDGAQELEIGYHLLPSAWGNGYATEAAIACKEFCRAHALAPSVISLIHPENARSEAVAKRNGMTVERMTVHRGTPARIWRVTLG